MGRTESFYTDERADKALRDEYLLTIHKGKKTSIVNAALGEYFEKHRPSAEKETAPPREKKVHIMRPLQ